jgi:murein DD-endopeptidase MepM/ murein hydrolase activator NlpD
MGFQDTPSPAWPRPRADEPSVLCCRRRGPRWNPLDRVPPGDRPGSCAAVFRACGHGQDARPEMLSASGAGTLLTCGRNAHPVPRTRSYQANAEWAAAMPGTMVLAGRSGPFYRVPRMGGRRRGC